MWHFTPSLPYEPMEGCLSPEDRRWLAFPQRPGALHVT